MLNSEKARINDVASWGDAVPNRQMLSQSRVQQSLPQTLPFVTSLSGVKPKTGQHQNKEKDTASNTDWHREILKEIAGKTNGKKGLCQIADKVTDILLPFILNFAHHNQYHSMGFHICQEKRRIDENDETEVKSFFSCKISPGYHSNLTYLYTPISFSSIT